MSNRLLVGLDFETTGTDPMVDVPIQVGLAVLEPFPTVFCVEIGGWDWNERRWGYEAQAIHGITKGWLEVSGLPRTQVDRMAVAWLEAAMDRVGATRNHTHFVGWNVGGFDMTLARRFLPGLISTASYRNLDLNSALLLATNNGSQMKRRKERLKSRAAVRANAVGHFPPDSWHNAGFDALASLYVAKGLSKEAAYAG